MALRGIEIIAEEGGGDECFIACPNPTCGQLVQVDGFTRTEFGALLENYERVGPMSCGACHTTFYADGALEDGYEIVEE